MKTRKEVAELAAILAVRMDKLNTYWIALDVAKLCRVAATAERIACALCNGELEQEKFDAKKARLQKRLSDIEDRYDVRFEIGGDPRGYLLHMFGINGQPIQGNTLGGDKEGYGI